MVDIPVRPQIAVDTVCRIIFRAREFDVKDTLTDEGDGSNPVDHNFVDILETHKNDPVVAELTAAIDGLDIDSQCDLVALAWVGRGNYGPEEWREARALAAQEHNNRTAAYLLGMPMLGDFLEEGLARFGLSCAEFEKNHL